MTQTITSRRHAVEAAANSFMEAIAEYRGWFIGLGILSILAGIAAIIFPLASTWAVEIIIGVTFTMIGLAQIIHAFGTRSWGGFFLDLLVGIIYGAAGIFLLSRPVEGSMILTIVVAATFFANGIANTIWSFQMERHSGWGWVLAGGLISLLLGGLLVANLPIDALWVLGTLAGVNLLASGISMTALAVAAGDAESEVKASTHTEIKTA